MGDSDDRSQFDREVLLLACLAKLFTYAQSRGYALTAGEGKILTPRKGADGVLRQDGEHMLGSLHYLGLAQDLNLFVKKNGVWTYVSDGGDPAWADLGVYWESLDPLCRWGGRFQTRDDNHVSIAYQGRA